MTRPADLVTNTDNVNGSRRPVTPCPGRDRTLHIRITRHWSGQGHEIHVWGPGMVERFGEPNVAQLHADQDTLRGWVSSLYRQWTSHAIEWRDPHDTELDASHRYPFADYVDVSRGTQPWQG